MIEAADNTVQYKLAPAYENFTGMLTSYLTCVKGVVTIPVGSVAKSGRILEIHYGAKKIEPKSHSEAKEVKK